MGELLNKSIVTQLLSIDGFSLPSFRSWQLGLFTQEVAPKRKRPCQLESSGRELSYGLSMAQGRLSLVSPLSLARPGSNSGSNHARRRRRQRRHGQNLLWVFLRYLLIDCSQSGEHIHTPPPFHLLMLTRMPGFWWVTKDRR